MKLMKTAGKVVVGIVITLLILIILPWILAMIFGMLAKKGKNWAVTPANIFKKISVIEFGLNKMNKHPAFYGSGLSQINNLSNSLSTNSYPNLPPMSGGSRTPPRRYDMSFSDKMNF